MPWRTNTILAGIAMHRICFTSVIWKHCTL